MIMRQTWLGDSLGLLIAVTRIVIPKGKRAVVSTGNHNTIFVDSRTVDDAIMTAKILQESTKAEIVGKQLCLFLLQQCAEG